MTAQTFTPANSAPYGALHSDDTLSKELVDEMQAIFGKHPGYRTSMDATIFDSDTKLIPIIISPCQRSSRGGNIHTN
jgi:hypothetical protein